MSYRFSFSLNNFMSVNSDGYGTFKFSPSNFIIPSQYVKLGMPNTLSGLATTIPANRLFFNYHVMAAGFVGGHQCFETYTLYADLALDNGSVINNTAIVSTSSNPNNGGNINSGWVEIPYTGNSVPYQISFYQNCSGSGCNIPLCPTNGWDSISISLKVDVTILDKDVCQEDPSNPFCKKSLIPSGQIDTFSAIYDDNMEYQSYWRRNRTAIIWFIIIVLVILIILAIIFATKYRDCSRWFKKKNY